MSVKLDISHQGEEHRVKVFGNRVLTRIFGPKRDEVAGGWRKLDNEELPNSIRMIKSRKMRLVGHVVHMGKMRNACKILVEKPEKKTPLKIPRCRREEKKLKWITGKLVWRVWVGLIWLRIGTSGGLL
jgi:hypothetical protein